MSKGSKFLLCLLCTALIIQMMVFWHLSRDPMFLWIAGGMLSTLVIGFAW
jgi:hypothetical protein